MSEETESFFWKWFFFILSEVVFRIYIVVTVEKLFEREFILMEKLICI